MSLSSCRALLVLTLVASLAGLSTVGQLRGQKKALQPVFPGGPPGGPLAKVPPKNVANDLGNLTLLKNDDLKDQLDFVEDSIKKADWDRVCETLQRLVGRDQDVWVPRQRRDANGHLQT